MRPKALRSECCDLMAERGTRLIAAHDGTTSSAAPPFSSTQTHSVASSVTTTPPSPLSVKLATTSPTLNRSAARRHTRSVDCQTESFLRLATPGRYLAVERPTRFSWTVQKSVYNNNSGRRNFRRFSMQTSLCRILASLRTSMP